MGTRGLTVVKADGEYKVAQYGQWDHYPKGQGLTVLKFCQDHLSKKKDRKFFKKKLDFVQNLSSDDIQKLYDGEGIHSQWITFDESQKLEVVFPSLHRNTGADILNIVLNAENNIPAQNEIAFAEDALFCEGIFLIDLDKSTFETYSSHYGDRNTRFPKLKLCSNYSLDELPSKERYLKDSERNEDEDE